MGGHDVKSMSQNLNRRFPEQQYAAPGATSSLSSYPQPAPNEVTSSQYTPLTGQAPRVKNAESGTVANVRSPKDDPSRWATQECKR